MLVFKPRLAAFYIILIAVILLLSNRFTISTPAALATNTGLINSTMVEAHK